MKKEDITYLINLIEKLKRTKDMIELHKENDTEVMLKQYQSVSNDTLFEIMQVLYNSKNRNHELANKISFNLLNKYPNSSSKKLIGDEEIITELKLMLG